MSGWIQTTLYGIFIRAGDPKPAPGSPKWIKHRRIIQVGCILLYLLYTVYETDWQLQREGDFYRILGVSPDAEERRIKSVARRLLAKSHPDKASSDTDQFILIRAASDVLSDPVKRFVYDRFGPTVMDCKQCVTVKDYIIFGGKQIYPAYLASAIGLGALYFIGYMQSGKYWRFLAMASLFAFEAFVITRPTWPALLTDLVNPIFTALRLRPPYLPFQAVAVARKLSIAGFIAHAQIMPLLIPPQQQGSQELQLKQQLDRLEALARHSDQEAGRLLALELTPFSADESSEKEIKHALKEWLIHNTVRSNPEVRGAMGRAIQRRRQGAPHGAQGTT